MSMRKLLVTAVAALAFLVPSSARAVIFLGVRGAYAMPSGDMAKDAPLKDQVSASIPVQIDAGTSVLDLVYLGAYASYGPTTLAKDVKDGCSVAGISCKATNLRFGAQAFLRPPVILKALWGGVFAGFEQQAISLGSADLKYRGWEAGLQAGYDISVLPFIKIGPFASFSMAEFQVVSGAMAIPGYGDTLPLTSKARHNTLTFGLRGLFDF